MNKRAGYVLTGGRSSRFGRNKAFVDVDGRPMAVHVAERIRSVIDSVALVGPATAYADLGLRVIEDSVDGFGPVAGILAAVEDSAAPWVLVVACDLPNIRPQFLEMLFRRAESSSVDAVIPLATDGRKQPLCAVYSKSMVEPLRQAVKGGVAKVTTAISGAALAYLLPSEYATLDPSGEMLLNVNRPDDLLMRR
jgi:molybdopterin-guanine dinucleotide biosynthesis protein A